MRLPAPERADAEADDVSLADRRIDELGAASQGAAVDQYAGQEHLGRIGREAQHHAGGICRGLRAAEATTAAPAPSTGPSATTRCRRLRHARST